MRSATLALLVLEAIAIAACAHEERRAPVQPASPEPASSPPPRRPAQYLVADLGSARPGAVAVPLGAPGVYGLAIAKRRVVFGSGEPRVAADATSEPIVGASRIPGRFGGGFLFWTSDTLYRSDAFDAKLVPLARLPDAIEAVSFAPKALLARTETGERWGLALPKAERAAIEPAGAADVQGLDDGRAVAIDHQGGVLTSLDGGAHWVDATAQVSSPPMTIEVLAGDLWLHEATGGAYRLERDGRLAWFQQPPPERWPELRPADPRWRGADPPLRTAFRSGAALDEETAIVVASGDLVRVDVRTGEIVSIVPGNLPPGADCEAVPAEGDVLFACVADGAGGVAFVASHTLSSDPPVIEQTFAAGGQFQASDDGGLVYSGPCRGGVHPPSAGEVACVRVPGGAWEERDVSALAVDAGGAADVTVVRWIPRADGRVVAVVSAPSAGIYDPETGSFRPLTDEAREALGRGAPAPFLRKIGSSAGVRLPLRRRGGRLVDASWSFDPGGALRGWRRQAESVEISEAGELTYSPYAFDAVFAGAMGLGRSADGRLYQSSDRGFTWVEVAAPPSGAEALELLGCTSAGCDLGPFYRVGWSLRAPSPPAPSADAPAAPGIRRTRGVELSCRPTGPVASKALARTDDSPDDLGFGARRAPSAAGDRDAFVHAVLAREIASPVRAATRGDSATPALRGLLSGFGTAIDGGATIALGPNRDPASIRRDVFYLAPFDPSGKVLRGVTRMSDVLAAGRRLGIADDELLAEDPTQASSVIPLTSVDPARPSGIALHTAGERGLVSLVRGDRARVALRIAQNDASVVSGVVLAASPDGADEAALLEVESSGAGRVFRLGPGGVSELFEVPFASDEARYPANLDALAIGPNGALAIVRTPSGGEPPSALDPALLVAPATAPSPLAPWSELALADDVACASEPGGYRAVIQALGPWIRVTNPELRVEEAPMLARVRWTERRVCLEGFEVRLPAVAVRPAGAGVGERVETPTWLVGKGASFARVGVAEGVEWRQPLECRIVSRGP